MQQKRQSLLTDQTQPIPSPSSFSPSPLSAPSPKQRLLSLDILRGLTMAGMLLVDDLQEGPWWLEHPDWNGFTFADLIFPSFLFCMGMAVPLSVTKTRKFGIKNIIRIVALFGIGVLLNLFEVKFNIYEFRVMGILQRISICYAALSLIHIITDYGKQSLRFIGILFTLAMLLIYLVLMLTFTNQQCPSSKNLEQYCNFGAYWDRRMFTQHHMIYPSDPEGLFTTLSSFLNAFLGYAFCLRMLDAKGQNITGILKFWAGLSVIFGIIAVPLFWLMPLNKKIWSVSYAFLTVCISGLSLVLITIIFDITTIDRPKYKKVLDAVSTPFLWLGRNPLAMFISRDFLDDVLNSYIVINNITAWDHLYHYLFKTWIGVKEIASVMFSLFLLAFFLLEAWLLYRKGIFIRL